MNVDYNFGLVLFDFAAPEYAYRRIRVNVAWGGRVLRGLDRWAWDTCLSVRFSSERGQPFSLVRIPVNLVNQTE